MSQKYYIGLDIGTNSIGWAVTDENYKLCKANRKAMWGIRLFEEANTAEERRTNRTARRRRQREKQRIEWLQDLFAGPISEVDPGFYHRMKESFYAPEDKRDLEGNTPALSYSLFADKSFTDKDYHEAYPTIYHLRKALMTDSGKFDIRLVYLALHHMMKHRGHFLFEGEGGADISFEDVYKRLGEEFAEYYIEDDEEGPKLLLGNEIADEFCNILKDRTLPKSQKKKSLTNLLNAKKNKQLSALLGLVSGTKESLKDLYGDPELDDIEKSKISFSQGNFEEDYASVEGVLMERASLLLVAKAVYDWALLADIKGEYSTLSEAKVAVYEEHKRDLKNLKEIIRKYVPEKYNAVFRKEEGNNYPIYIGKNKTCSRDDFYKFIKGVLKPVETKADVQEILKKIEQETFMPKQAVKENGVIPHQLHLQEMKRILKNAEQHYSFLTESDEEGRTVSDKILAIFNFKIPYYVGPLNTAMVEKGFGWAIRKEEGKIYPWNIEEKINYEASAEAFIRRMTNKCTYYYGKDVLPKYSILYSKFTVLNELNNLKVNGDPISVGLKQEIFTDLFMRYKKVTQKKLKEYLVRKGLVKKDKVELTGIDGDFKSSLRPSIEFKEILSDTTISEEMLETVILDITLFGAEKKMLKQRIRQLLPGLTDKQINRISELPYTGWGRLSKEFLTEITATDPESGEVLNIINMLYETNDNLMQLLSEKYQFKDKLDTLNSGVRNYTMTYKTVKELYVSPAVKRAIWQTMEIVKEIVKVMKCEPEKIFVEMTREDGKKNTRTISRRQNLIDLYKKCKEEERAWIQELEGKTDGQLRGDKLYLYYLQMGRCMYSGEPIDLADLFNDQLYDIDHIYPQAKVMDDSLDNRVLVKRQLNAQKGDSYPISSDIQMKCSGLWRRLKDKGFLSEEKYKRLTRKDGFSESELAGFIARQIVETSQSTKAVAEILKNVYQESQIVYVKAKVVSKFRQKYDLIKVRDVNDFHHAKDAYLNIVVGNTYNAKFTSNPLNFVRTNQRYSYNIEKLFDNDVSRGGMTAWKAGKAGTISTVKALMRKNNILFTRYAYEAKGSLFDQQLMKKRKGQVPIKGHDERLSDIDKYGGYNMASGAYFILVESLNQRGEKIRTLEAVPIYLKAILERDENSLIQYCTNHLGLKEPRIVLQKIKIDSLFKVDGFYMHLSGRTGRRLKFKNANQLCLDEPNMQTIKEASKYHNRLSLNKEAKLEPNERISDKRLLSLYETFQEKIEKTIYGKRLSAQIKVLEGGREKFKLLTLEQKALSALQILNFFKCNSNGADLRVIGGAKEAGILVMNGEISKCSSCILINQSSTGIFEQEIDLLTI
ncbi:MAG: type II CRISPR RNA-guided endonuclease Cas9 [Firmicutes bacterium]|nr:type II CRISPR RNA-guided endonuclease Cas9 [Bacillota bacterium]